MVVTFIGHRDIRFGGDLPLRLKELLLTLIDDRGADTFLFGSRSDFDELCLEVVTELQRQRRGIKRVYVRAEYPYVGKGYEEGLLCSYDATYIPSNVAGAGRAAYVERNRHMIDRADICVFYYDEGYEPPPKPAARGRAVGEQPKSGTKIAYEYALRRGKEIVNLFHAAGQGARG